MKVSDSLLEILRCPSSGQLLREADEEDIMRMNQLIEEGKLVDGEDERILQPLEGALLCEDRSAGYPIDDGFPVLLLSRRLLHSDGQPL